MDLHILKTFVFFIFLTGCTGLHPPQVETSHIYVLNAQTTNNKPYLKRDFVLAVNMPRALAGFDTSKMVYLRKPHELNYFAVNRWADTPAHMLEPLLIQALEETLSFKAVVRVPSIVPANVRLETELIRLQQDFETKPSKVQLTLKAQLIEVTSKRVLAVKIFDDIENSSSDDAYGGVNAANQVMQRVLSEVADFCVNESVGH